MRSAPPHPQIRGMETSQKDFMSRSRADMSMFMGFNVLNGFMSRSRVDMSMFSLPLRVSTTAPSLISNYQQNIQLKTKITLKSPFEGMNLGPVLSKPEEFLVKISEVRKKRFSMMELCVHV